MRVAVTTTDDNSPALSPSARNGAISPGKRTVSGIAIRQRLINESFPRLSIISLQQCPPRYVSRRDRSQSLKYGRFLPLL
jgi:hypothetical protein